MVTSFSGMGGGERGLSGKSCEHTTLCMLQRVFPHKVVCEGVYCLQVLQLPWMPGSSQLTLTPQDTGRAPFHPQPGAVWKGSVITPLAAPKAEPPATALAATPMEKSSQTLCRKAYAWQIFVKLIAACLAQAAGCRQPVGKIFKHLKFLHPLFFHERSLQPTPPLQN